MPDAQTSFLPHYLSPLTGLVDQGGPVVLLLLALSVIAVTLIAAKVLQFASLGVGRFSAARKALDFWLEGRPQEARAMLTGTRSVAAGILVRLFQSGVRSGTQADLLKEDVERICLQRLHGLRSYLRPLDMIAQTAPLIGLFGTVLGMIEAFRAMQGAGAAVDPSVLAGGIWVALLTTAVGLAVAIPVSAIVGWFDGLIEAEQAEMEALVTAYFTGAIAERGSARIVPLGAPEARHAV
jgi:biopolymer transport protein ExbB